MGNGLVECQKWRYGLLACFPECEHTVYIANVVNIANIVEIIFIVDIANIVDVNKYCKY